MKSWRTHLAVLLTFAVLGLLMRWLLPDPVPKPREPVRPGTIADKRPDLRPPDPTPPPPQPEPVDRDAVEAVASVMAEEQGLGWIRCDLTGHDLPEARVTGAFERADVRDGILVATVRTPSGRTTVHATLTREERRSPIASIEAQVANANQPLVGITWSDAYEGQQGHCEVKALGRIRVSGTVVDTDGNPWSTSTVSVRGCGAQTRPITDGRFETEWFAGLPCTVVAFAHDAVGNRATGPGTTVSSEADVSGVVVVGPEALSNPVERLWEERAEHEAALVEAEAKRAALERAYASDGLSEDARLVIEERLLAVDRRIDRLQRSLERELPDPGSWVEPEEDEEVWFE